MKNLISINFSLFASLFIFIAISCSKDTDELNVSSIEKDKLSGCVQKGPYINGTTIQMYELSETLGQTGKSFSTKIIDNKGSFEISNISLSSQYVEFSARGYYFNEIIGDISPSELSLNAYADIKDISTVNVNILTHLEKDRVNYLVQNGMTFSEAKDAAQSELLAPFGFGTSTINNSENLNIAENNDGNAILLAVSVIFQGNRSVGDLTELLANVSTDFFPDGIISDENITLLRNSAVMLDCGSIRANLENRYAELGVNATIPDFENYVEDFINFTGQKPEVAVTGSSSVSMYSSIVIGSVHAFGMNTTVTFEYGTTTDYGTSVSATQNPLNTDFPIIVSAKITGLLPQTTYHFRIKAENEKGISYSDDAMFTTAKEGVNNMQYIKFESYYSQDDGQVNVHEIQAFQQEVNVALNKPASANSYEWGDSGYQAVDGNDDSRWSSQRNDPGPDAANPHYIIIDLQELLAIERIRLNIGQYNQTFVLSVSQDKINWTPVIQGEEITGVFTYDFNSK